MRDITNVDNLNDYIVCGYFTPDYAQLAGTLSESLNRFKIPHHLFAIEKLPGGWEVNTMVKPEIVLKAMDHYPGLTVVFLDADAQACRDLTPLAKIRGDIAASVITKRRAKRNPRMFIRTGTLVIQPTPEARKFVTDWRDECRISDRFDIDQTTFALVLSRSTDLAFQPLDLIWCAREGETKSAPAAIIHGKTGKATGTLERFAAWMHTLVRRKLSPIY